MPRFTLLATTAAVTLSQWAGCRSIRELPPVPETLHAASTSRDPRLSEASIWQAEHERLDDGPQFGSSNDILVLSGGGRNGAFSAGMLTGWTDSGQRPEFDVVTGVSTGALIAPFAFLGKEYDSELRRLYTSDNAADIYKMLPLFLWREAAASSKPLRHQIRHAVTDGLLAQIAREHRRGRRLYIGTTNLDAQKLVVWDIGAIATSHDPHKRELVQDIMLASCSVPGLFAPVTIQVEREGRRYVELHVDGGVSASMFLPPQVLGLASNGIATDASQATVYTIVAGKADPDPIPVRRGLLQLSGASLSGVLRARQEHDLMRIYLMAWFANARFQLAPSLRTSPPPPARWSSI